MNYPIKKLEEVRSLLEKAMQIGKGRDQRMVGPGRRRDAKRGKSKADRKAARQDLADPAERGGMATKPTRTMKGWES